MNNSQKTFLLVAAVCGLGYVGYVNYAKPPVPPASTSPVAVYANDVAAVWQAVADNPPKTGLEITEFTRNKMEAARKKLVDAVNDECKPLLGDGTTELDPVKVKALFGGMAKKARR